MPYEHIGTIVPPGRSFMWKMEVDAFDDISHGNVARCFSMLALPIGASLKTSL